MADTDNVFSNFLILLIHVLWSFNPVQLSPMRSQLPIACATGIPSNGESSGLSLLFVAYVSHDLHARKILDE